MARVNEKCFWYCKDYTQRTDKDQIPRHWCELRGELNVEPNYYICNYCKQFVDKEDMKEKLESKRKREEQNKNKWEISAGIKRRIRMIGKIKKFFKEYWPLFVVFSIIIIAIFSIWKLGHFIDLKELHSYDYVSIDGVIYNTEDIDDISICKYHGATFYIKGTTKTICTTQYTYFNKEDLEEYLRVTKTPETKEKEILID